MSTTLLKERAEDARLESRVASETERRIGVVTWLVVALAVLAVLAVAAGVVGVLVTGGGQELPPAGYTVEAVDEDVALRSLIAQGYIPHAAFDWDAHHAQRANDLGLIPHEVHQEPLYTAEELATMQGVARGELPEELIETEWFVTKRLVNQGWIPEETLR